jgi:predicted ribosomally synthesized peptide with nif11-like leader
MKINPNEITKEMLEKAMQCETADELIELAKSEGFDITKEEAEAYLDELSEQELDVDDIKQVAGGAGPGCPSKKDCPPYCVNAPHINYG